MGYAMKMHDVREEAQQKTKQLDARNVAIILKRCGHSKEYIHQFLSNSFGKQLPKESIDEIIESLV